MKKLPQRSRTDLMLLKQAGERNFVFKNRELAKRYAMRSVDWIPVVLGILWFIVLTVIMPHSWAYRTPMYAVIAMMASAIGLVLLTPVWLKFSRRVLYAQASDLVCRQEPVHVHLKLFEQKMRTLHGGTWSRWKVKVLPDGEEYGLAPDIDANRLANERPQLLHGAEGEVYFNSKGRLLGLFADDHVEWFI